MSNFGLPYQGSKSKIVKDLVRLFPAADNFYDLFGGGFSVTHAMLVYRKKDFKHFHFNEIRPGICGMIKGAIAGKYSYDNFLPEFISRERFLAEKETNPYIKICWSFGNNGEGYLFGKDIESDKRSAHNAIVFNQFDDRAIAIFGFNKFPQGIGVKDRRLHLRNKIKVKQRKMLDAQQLQQLQQLESLERLEQLEQFQQLQQLNFYEGDYSHVPISPNSVIYCDIPYYGTGEYDKNKNFNRKSFLDWAAESEHPVFISEYNVKDDRFVQVWKKEVISRMSAIGPTSATEKLYCNKTAYKALLKRMLR